MGAEAEAEAEAQALAEAAEVEAARTEISEDGLVIDLDTGEIIGHQLPDEVKPYGGPGASAEDAEKLAEYVLRRIQRHDARLASAIALSDSASRRIEEIQKEALAKLEESAEMIELRAIERNADDLANRASNAAQYFRGAYEAFFRVFAQSQLAGRKERTWRCPFGQISLRKRPEKLVVADEAAAPEQLRKLGYGAAIKQSVQVSKLDAAAKVKLIELIDKGDAKVSGFSVERPDDAVEVKSGVVAS